MSVNRNRAFAVDTNRQVYRTESLGIALFAGLPVLFSLTAGQSAVALLVFVVALALYGAVARREILVADPIVVLGLAYVLAAALPFLATNLYLDEGWTLLGGELMHTAAAWTYRGYVAMAVAYLAVSLMLSQRSPIAGPRAEPREVSARFVTIVGAFGLSGALLMFALLGGPIESFQETAFTGQASTLLQIADTLNFLGYAYIYLYRVVTARGAATRAHRYLLWGIVAMQVIFAIGAGSKAILISLLVMVLLPTGHERPAAGRTALWKQVAILLATVTCVYLVFQVITAYRDIMRNSVLLGGVSGWDRVALQFESFMLAIQTALGFAPAGEAVMQTGNILDRFAYVSSFARLLVHTRGQPPYEAAWESFLLPLYAILPRDLFDKPMFFNSADLARLEGWSFGGISLSLPGSLYWTWGYIGIVAGMAAIGAFIAWVVSRAHENVGAKVSFHLLKAVTILILMDVGNAFQSVVINLIRYAAFVWILDFIVRKSLEARLRPARVSRP